MFFSGEIVNPKNDFVVLYHNDIYVDSVKLDVDNRFSFQLEGLQEGLYYFSHSPEHQSIYLKGGDSILARLNTLEFDETLVYSGAGSGINNFMIEMYLAHEQEEPLIQNYYTLDPKEFSKKIDSLRKIKTDYLKELEKENDFSNRVSAMAMAAIDYGTYIHKEKYPFDHKRKTGEDAFHDLDGAFYGYRKIIDFDNPDLTFYRPYFDFMKMHFGNLAYMNCLANCQRDEINGSRRLHFIDHRMDMVDSLVRASELRNVLFRSFTMDYLSLVKKHSPNQGDLEFLEQFQSLSSNEAHKEEVSLLYNSIKNLQPDSEVPNLRLRDAGNHQVNLQDVIKGQGHTVLYFWTASQKRHFENVRRHIEKLQEKYPEYRFVGINLRTSFPQWTTLLKEYGLEEQDQYYGENFKEIQTTMYLDGLNKCILAKDSLVVDGFADIFKL